MKETTFLNSVRCVDAPDANQGLWMRIQFEPTDYVLVGDEQKPVRYMVRWADVYMITGDWAVKMSGSSGVPAYSQPRTSLVDKNPRKDHVCKWFHVSDIALADIQRRFMGLEGPADQLEEDEEWRGLHKFTENGHMIKLVDQAKAIDSMF